ncbi:MAG: PQQ-binding-like beta-propeller repeat protein, partial [Planctomycetaceae bacterium]
DRVYFGSDDGHAYCITADQGSLVWKLRAGPADEWLLARGEMISRWPVRTGVLVDGGVAFFGGGIFPHEDVFLYAVDAADGSVIWRQDNISVQDAGRNDLSPQGYLLANEKYLFVPSGRTLPAVFERSSGKFLHKRTHAWRTTAGGVVGGTSALLADGQLYASGEHHWLAMDQERGDVGFGWFAGRQIVVQGDAAYAVTGSHVAKYDRLAYAVNSRLRHDLEMKIFELGKKSTKTADEKAALKASLAQIEEQLKAIAMVGIHWQQKTEDDAALLATENVLFVGGDGRVTAYDAADGAALWDAEVDGKARGLVFAEGALLVSTTSGQITCFAAASSPRDQRLAANTEPDPAPYPNDELSKLYAEGAEQILAQSGIRRGYCLVVGAERGRLAWELAKRSDLRIYAIDSDPQKVDDARRSLLPTGLYGHRIVVHHADPSDTFYSNYFANLIVSDSSLLTKQLPQGMENIVRHLKPEGGVILLPQQVAEPWLEEAKLSTEIVSSKTDQGTKITRGTLPGAGDWTHQYGNPGNTAVSTDRRIKGGLGVLWYGDPGPDEMVNRHDGAVGPLSVRGRLIVQGESSISAYDAYNGLFLWRHENPDAIRTGVFQNQNPANVAASETSVFHFVGDLCYQLDLETGSLQRTHKLPPELDDGNYQWGYLAVEDDILFGAATVRTELEARQRRRGRQTEDNTDFLFAIDLKDGKHLWNYEGQHISHHAIAIGPREVFFVDSSISNERREALLLEDKTELAKLTGQERDRAEQLAKNADIRRAVSLDARTGKVRWAQSVDVTDCSDIGIGGGKLTLMYHNGVLVLGGANANGHYWQQFIDGEFKTRRLVALYANDGSKLWARDANYKNRPIVIGDKILAEPWMYDLHTGTQITQTHPVTEQEVPWSLMRTGHHCGMFTGCDSGMLLFRSGDTAFYDLEAQSGTRHFAGHRLGCWINAIPASGLVMIPEASAGCVCLYSISSTIVMEPREPRREWAIHSATGPLLPVRQLAINLGAPGDRYDASGKMWLAYPRPRAYKETSLDIALKLDMRFRGASPYWNVNEELSHDIASAHPWLYSSGASGLEELTIPLRGPEDGPATYDIKLHFTRVSSDASAAGRVTEDDWSSRVTFTGETISRSDDVAAGGRLSELIAARVRVDGSLQVSLPAADDAPRLAGIEIRVAE